MKIKYTKKPSEVGKFRKEWLDKGYDLVNITKLCDLKLGESGWCNDFNEPQETCHFIQIWYRNELVAQLGAKGGHAIDDDRFIFWVDPEEDFLIDFIIFMKVPIQRKK